MVFLNDHYVYSTDNSLVRQASVQSKPSLTIAVLLNALAHENLTDIGGLFHVLLSCLAKRFFFFLFPKHGLGDRRQL